jgi:hypothetical protein
MLIYFIFNNSYYTIIKIPLTPGGSNLYYRYKSECLILNSFPYVGSSKEGDLLDFMNVGFLGIHLIIINICRWILLII